MSDYTVSGLDVQRIHEQMRYLRAEAEKLRHKGGHHQVMDAAINEAQATARELTLRVLGLPMPEGWEEDK